MKNRQSKFIFFALVLAAATAACSGGSSTPAVPGMGLGSSLQADTSGVNLRSARTFAILAGTTVTSTGATSIKGNVGIFPGTATTGFPPGEIHGNLYAGGPTAQQAEMDLTTAYNAAMAKVHNPIAVAGNLGGQTLKPGLYKSTSGLAVSSGDLTLDGGGNANAVWVFQTATTFNMTTGRKVILTNSARASNIYWAVGSSATLGTGCSFRGNLLVHISISMKTGSVMVGRALARLGAVTMQGNTIVRPAL